MPNKSKHAFGALERIDSAMASGAINAYDILFVKDANGKPYIGWIDKNGNKTVIDYVSVDTITDLEALIATKATMEEVDTQIDAAMAENLVVVKTYVDTEIETQLTEILDDIQEYIDALEENYDTKGAAAAVQTQLDAEVTRAKGREDEIESAMNSKAAQSDLNKLTSLIGTIPSTATATNIVAYIQEKTAGVSTNTSLTELTGRVAQAETNITNIQNTVNTVNSLASGAKAQINNLESLYETDKASFIAADTQQLERIMDLERTLAGSSGSMNFKGVVDSDPTAEDFDVAGYEQGDIVIFDGQQYVFNDGIFTLAGNTSLDSSVVSDLTGRISVLEMDVGNINTSKVDQSAFNETLKNLQDADADLQTRIVALEGGSGAGTGTGITDEVIANIRQSAVEEAIAAATAKDEALEALLKKYADDEDAKIETAIDDITVDVSILTGKVPLIESNVAKNKAAQEATQASLESAIARIAKNEQDIASLAKNPGSGEGTGADIDTDALLAVMQEYIDEAVAQKTQVQIITWGADD